MNIFIPIKGNSQRVPKKNFKLIKGIPLYKHCLYKFAKDFKIYVDTDSDAIFDNIEKDPNLKNVTVFKRYKNLIGDTVSVCDLISNFIKKFNIQGNICQLHVTSPLLTLDTIINASKFFESGYDSIVSCDTVQTRIWRKEKYGYCPVAHNPTKLEQSQDLPKLYIENNAFFMFNSDLFLNTKTRVGNNPYFYEIQFPENIDIDTHLDIQTLNSLKENYNVSSVS